MHKYYPLYSMVYLRVTQACSVALYQTDFARSRKATNYNPFLYLLYIVIVFRSYPEIVRKNAIISQR